MKNNQSVLTALAASDIIVMAIYFSLLTYALKSDVLKKRFGTIVSSAISDVTHESESLSYSPKSTQGMIAFLISTVLSFSLVAISQKVESVASIPGLSSAALCMIAPFTISIIKRISSPSISQQISAVSPILSSFIFHLFFSAIGASINLSTCLFLAPSAFVFALLSLALHTVILFSLSAFFCDGKKDKKSSSLFALEEILISSNAAIGGPVTAATFAANQCGLNQDYIMAATIWGVIGYASGTTAGVSLFSLLSKF